MIFCVLVFISGLISLLFVRKHYLLSLLSLEFFLISLFYYCYYFFGFYNFDYFFCIIYLVFGVCDGVIGLSFLVFLLRKVSHDYFDSLSLC